MSDDTTPRLEEPPEGPGVSLAALEQLSRLAFRAYETEDGRHIVKSDPVVVSGLATMDEAQRVAMALNAALTAVRMRLTGRR